MSSNAPGNIFVPKTQEQKVDTFLVERGMTFLEMLQLHATFLRDPIGTSCSSYRTYAKISSVSPPW